MSRKVFTAQGERAKGLLVHAGLPILALPKKQKSTIKQNAADTGPVRDQRYGWQSKQRTLPPMGLSFKSWQNVASPRIEKKSFLVSHTPISKVCAASLMIGLLAAPGVSCVSHPDGSWLANLELIPSDL